MKQDNRALPPANVDGIERGISLVTGSFLLYNSLAGKKKSLPKALLAGLLLFRGATGFCPVRKALGSESNLLKAHNVNIKVSLLIQKPRNEVYNFWRKLENLPLFMKHLKSVVALDEKNSEWEAKVPGGLGTIKWTSEIVKDIPNEHIGWASLPGSTIENSGNVKFIELSKDETEIHVVISYHAPLGIAGEGIGRLLNPAFEETIKGDIKGLKQYLETGKLPDLKIA
jgi:uncharacterized membrane protein